MITPGYQYGVKNPVTVRQKRLSVNAPRDLSSAAANHGEPLIAFDNDAR